MPSNPSLQPTCCGLRTRLSSNARQHGHIMSIRSAVLIAVLALATGLIRAEPANVLYIGNSYTYYHRMPATVAAMARAEGSPRELHAKVVAVPAATLKRHWDSGVAQSAIRERKWDYVVLQEQSQQPLEQKERMYEYVRLLDKEIKLNGARTILFVTWARRDRPESQPELTAAYDAIARELGAVLAPVGPAWQIALQGATDLSLYEQDGSHPTPNGSYLAACVLYLTLQPTESQCPGPTGDGVVVHSVEVLRAAAASVVANQRR